VSGQTPTPSLSTANILNSSNLLEGLLLVIISLLNQYPDGEFLDGKQSSNQLSSSLGNAIYNMSMYL
jgi:hypothetical protein